MDMGCESDGNWSRGFAIGLVACGFGHTLDSSVTAHTYLKIANDQQMRRAHITPISGTGTVSHEDGPEIGEVRYSLQISEPILHARARGNLLPDISGRISGLGDTFELIGAPLVLHLKDGRQWGFFIKDMSGTVVNRTGFLDPDGV